MKRFLIIMLIITFSVSVIFMESGCKEINKSSGQNSTETGMGETIDTSSKIAVNRIAFVSKEYPDNNNEIYIMNLEGSMRTRLTNNSADDSYPCFSPDGTKIAFISNRDGNNEIYIMNVDGSEQVNLTNNSAVDSKPCFSPDGTKICFVSGRDGNAEIYIVNIDSLEQRRITNNPASDTDPCFSPDGTKIVFVSNRDGNREIYIMNIDGSDQVNLTNNMANDFNPCFSPDGTKICFVSGRDGNREIYIMNVDGSEQVNLTNNSVNDGHPSLSPDGSKIIFESQHYTTYKSILIESSAICIMNIDGSEQVTLAVDEDYDLYASFSPDGSKIIFESKCCGGIYNIYSSNIDVSEQVNLIVEGSTPVYFPQLWMELGGGRYPVYSPIMDETRAGAEILEITMPETDETGNIFPEDLGDYYLSMEFWEFGVLDNLLISKSGFIEYSTPHSEILYDHKIGKISEESIEKLSELIEDSGFFDLEDVYECPENLIVEGTIRISVFRDGEVKSVEELGADAPDSFYCLVDYLQEQIIARLQDDLKCGTFIKAEKLVSSTSKNIISNEELEAQPLLAKAIQNPGWLIYVDTLTNAGLDDYIDNDEHYFYLSFEGNDYQVSVYERQK